MFRPLLGYHQFALSLQGNCITQTAYLMGDEISFTMVRYMNPINRMVPIFAICIIYIDWVHISDHCKRGLVAH